jgi:DNA polymerase III subunit epsilon
VRVLLGAHRSPAHLAPDLADDLPEGPGVYRFFDADNTVLYVDKSRSLRSAVCGHFAAGTGSAANTRLAARVRRVDWLETHGELGALLKEAEWQRTLQPVFNRRTHGDRSYTLRVRAAASAGQARPVEAAALDSLEAAELPQSFGVFHSEKDARKALGDIARAHRLCLKVLGLEDTSGSCFAYQVGKCRGVCVGKEPPVLHDMRVMLALSSLKLKAWPFPGRVALCERDFGGTALHVVDHWIYLGTARTDEELAALGGRSDAAFDAHVYRILARHLARHPKLEWIDLQRPGAGSNGLVAAYNETVVRRQFDSKQ